MPVLQLLSHSANEVLDPAPTPAPLSEPAPAPLSDLSSCARANISCSSAIMANPRLTARSFFSVFAISCARCSSRRFASLSSSVSSSSIVSVMLSAVRARFRGGANDPAAASAGALLPSRRSASNGACRSLLLALLSLPLMAPPLLPPRPLLLLLLPWLLPLPPETPLTVAPKRG